MSTSQQPEALRLADEVDEVAQTYPDMAEVSAELRRLHAENAELWHGAGIAKMTISTLTEQRDELLAALRMNAQSLAWLAHGKCRGFHPGLPTAEESLDAARAAIAKAGGAA